MLYRLGLRKFNGNYRLRGLRRSRRDAHLPDSAGCNPQVRYLFGAERSAIYHHPKRPLHTLLVSYLRKRPTGNLFFVVKGNNASPGYTSKQRRYITLLMYFNTKYILGHNCGKEPAAYENIRLD